MVGGLVQNQKQHASNPAEKILMRVAFKLIPQREGGRERRLDS